MGSEVVVSIISGGFLVVVALIHKLIRDNKTDHGIVRDSLNRIETKLDHHIDTHE